MERTADTVTNVPRGAAKVGRPHTSADPSSRRCPNAMRAQTAYPENAGYAVPKWYAPFPMEECPMGGPVTLVPIANQDAVKAGYLHFAVAPSLKFFRNAMKAPTVSLEDAYYAVPKWYAPIAMGKCPTEVPVAKDLIVNQVVVKEGSLPIVAVND